MYALKNIIYMLYRIPQCLITENVLEYDCSDASQYKQNLRCIYVHPFLKFCILRKVYILTFYQLYLECNKIFATYFVNNRYTQCGVERWVDSIGLTCKNKRVFKEKNIKKAKFCRVCLYIVFNQLLVDFCCWYYLRLNTFLRHYDTYIMIHYLRQWLWGLNDMKWLAYYQAHSKTSINVRHYLLLLLLIQYYYNGKQLEKLTSTLSSTNKLFKVKYLFSSFQIKFIILFL